MIRKTRKMRRAHKRGGGQCGSKPAGVAPLTSVVPTAPTASVPSLENAISDINMRLRNTKMRSKNLTNKAKSYMRNGNHNSARKAIQTRQIINKSIRNLEGNKRRLQRAKNIRNGKSPMSRTLPGVPTNENIAKNMAEL